MRGPINKKFSLQTRSLYKTYINNTKFRDFLSDLLHKNCTRIVFFM